MIMKISVIIPTYKPKDYLRECLESLCNQSLSPNEYEIIIVLNGCKAPYEEKIWNYINTHNNYNWRFIQINQGGVSNARNKALKEAQGEFITFIDDDDYISPSYLEELYRKGDKDTVVCSNAYAFNDGMPDVEIPYVMADAFDEYVQSGKRRAIGVRKFFSGPWMKLIPRNIVNGREFDTRLKNSEDSLFMFLISDRIKYVDFTSPNAIYYRRYRENSAITIKKSKGYVINNSLMVIGQYTKIYFRHPLNYSFRRYIQAVLGMFHYIMVNI